MNLRLSNCANILLLAITGIVSPCAAMNFPKGANVINVRDFGIVGDGKTDNTKALNDFFAIGTHYGKIAYFPNGTYLVSGIIHISVTKSLWGYHPKYAHRYLYGQSRDSTIIKLVNGAAGFGDNKSPKPILSYAEDGVDMSNTSFENMLIDLTIDAGNNQGAIGVRWTASNTGMIRNVRITAEPNGGRYGLDLTTVGGQGPFLIRDLDIQSFDYGIHNAYQKWTIYSVTVAKLAISKSRMAGIYTSNQPLFLQDFSFTAGTVSVPALINGPGTSLITILGGKFHKGQSGSAALENIYGGGMYLRDIEADGYGATVRYASDSISEKHTLTGKIAEFVSHTVKGSSSAPQALKLPRQPLPTVLYTDTAKWVNIADFGAGHYKQSASAIQSAIDFAADKGYELVYFPNSASTSNQEHNVFTVNKSIRIHGSVKVIAGFHNSIHVDPQFAPKGEPIFIVEAGSKQGVTIENLSIATWPRSDAMVSISNASTRDIILRNCVLGGSAFQNTVPGSRLFIEDCVGNGWKFTGIDVWAWQINPEAGGASGATTIGNILNEGSNLWVLGLKTEGEKTVLTTRKQGSSEICGAFVYPYAGNPPAGVPAFDVIDSRMSLSVINYGGLYNPLIRKETNGKVSKVTVADSPFKGKCLFPLYSDATSTTTVAQNLATTKELQMKQTDSHIAFDARGRLITSVLERDALGNLHRRIETSETK